MDPTGLICYWNQSTGHYKCTDSRSGKDGAYAEGDSYSGKGDCKNNPACENKANQGPIPKGCYAVGPSTKMSNGVSGRRLYPITGQGQNPNNSSRNMDSFFLHGDNEDGTASEGCPIINKGDRDEIPTQEIFCVY